MPLNSTAISKTVAAIAIVIVLIVASISAYLLVSSNQIGSEHTTVTVGGANYNETLVDLAKAEGGSLTIYGVMDTSDWPTINNILLQSFPWMKVNYVGLDPGTIASKGLSDYQTGHVQADVFVDTLGPIIQLIQGGAVNPFNNYQEALVNISSSNRDPSNYWHPAFQLPIVLEYNTNKVTATQAAQLQSMTIEQVLNDSSWKGQIALDSPSLLNVAGTLFASLYYYDFHSNNASWTAWMQSVKANNPQWQASGGDVYTAVSTGSAAIGIGLLNDYLGGAAGAPVKLIWYSTTYGLPVASAMAKNAPQPYTAELFIQWLTSYDGQVALSLTGRQPYMSIVLHQYFGNVIPTNTTVISGGVFPGSTYYTNADSWAAYYSSTIH